MGSALTGAPLSFVLLFCFFSFLFGAFSAVFSEGCRAIFAALRLLPNGDGAKRPFSAHCSFRVKKEQKEEETPCKRQSGITARSVIGYFLYDLFFWISLSCLYMLFIYAVNRGVFRLYSFFFAVLGFFFFRKTASRFFARPLLLLLSWLFSLLGLFLRFFPWLLFIFFRRSIRKKRKKLDESQEMV